MAKPPVSEQVQVNFRMPVDLRDRIKAASEAEGVSMNHLIITALEEKYPPPLISSQISRLIKHQGELFDRIMAEPDGPKRDALVAEFLSLRSKFEALADVDTLNSVLNHPLFKGKGIL
ncbi:Arc family DNA-binding protein [Paenirhodobacter populi]|uniref:Arc family DNA-binding protein n=1 Tax=Paenirhodobacter populi TaxID=2306993 RepID=A0A443IQT5_9RHOB|nr:Arc family DNA-binding protein [Sinirhodobacter populi]RWR08514.1 Arc family DNA-binding protein [Sinirhodobacter populi]